MMSGNLTQISSTPSFPRERKSPETLQSQGSGGEGEIRTLAGVTPTNSLANCPLRPTWVLLHAEFISCTQSGALRLFTGGEKGVRTLDRLASVPVFKTGAISQLDHLSSCFDMLCYFTMPDVLCQIFLSGKNQYRPIFRLYPAR